jgi:hypothetical protein
MVTRRAVLSLLALGGLTAYAAHKSEIVARPGTNDAATPIDIEAISLNGFGSYDSKHVVFKSGVQLRSATSGFGGFSGLWRASDGKKLVAVSDAGSWLTSDLTLHPNGTVGAFKNAILAPILGSDGLPVSETKFFDTEALAISDGIAYIGVERVHALLAFPWAKDGVNAKARPLKMPDLAKRLPSNRSLEAVAVAAKTSPLKGALIAIAERARSGDEAPTRGFLFSAAPNNTYLGTFDVARSDGFDITDAAFLPNHDLLILERRYTPLTGVALRIKRIAVGDIKVGARLQGETLLHADMRNNIDNMEGLAVHTVDSETRLTLISDDNFSMLQRTVLLEFALMHTPVTRYTPVTR